MMANSDDLAYGGSGYSSSAEFSTVEGDDPSRHVLRVTLPPLSLVVLKRKA
jgi:hypothetical protein